MRLNAKHFRATIENRCDVISVDRDRFSDSPRIPVILEAVPSEDGRYIYTKCARLNTRSGGSDAGASVRGVITEISSRFRGTSGQFACEMRIPAGCLTARFILSPFLWFFLFAPADISDDRMIAHRRLLIYRNNAENRQYFRNMNEISVRRI